MKDRIMKMVRSLYETKNVQGGFESKIEEGFINILIGTVFAAILAILVAVFVGESLLTFPLMAILTLVFGIAAWLISGSMMWFIGNLLGGNANWQKYLTAISYPLAGGIILSSILELIPVVGWIFGLLVTAGVFFAYVFVTEKEHNISLVKAVVTVLSPTLIILLLAFVLGITLFSGIEFAGIIAPSFM